MDGATPDVGDRFRSIARALDADEVASAPAGDAPDALRLRGSDEDEWKPLLVAAGDD